MLIVFSVLKFHLNMITIFQLRVARVYLDISYNQDDGGDIMKKENIKYYYILSENIFAKCVGNHCQLLNGFKWESDYKNTLHYGLEAFMDQNNICKLDTNRALKEISEIIVNCLVKKWKASFEKEKKEWKDKPGWPAKLVETNFELNGIKYTLDSYDICPDVDYWREGFMESIQSELTKDLKEIGATNIHHEGFLD